MRVRGEEIAEDIAISLLKSGMPIESVVKHTKLSESVVNELQKELETL
jgi:hypothetical protein